MMKRILTLLLLFTFPAHSQEQTGQASVKTSIDETGAGKIVVEARGTLPELPVFYSSEVQNQVAIGQSKVTYAVEAKARMLQGDAKTVSFHTRGLARITGVTGKTVAGWAVRWDGEKRRFLDVSLKKLEEPVSEHSFQIKMEEDLSGPPSTAEITNFSPDPEHANGFHQIVTLTFATGISGRVTRASGFFPVSSDAEAPSQYQTTIGGSLAVDLRRSSSTPAPVELIQSDLTGQLSENGKSVEFVLKGKANVTEANAELRILGGTAAIAESAARNGSELILDQDTKGPFYLLRFSKLGESPVHLRFVVPVLADKGWNRIHFELATGAVAPFSLHGLKTPVELRADSSFLPEVSENGLSGFLPASGSCHLSWKENRKVGQGKLFFSTSAKVETSVGAGLLRQTHDIDYKILQGKLERLTLDLEGPGEVLEVTGTNVIGWDVSAGTPRKLTVSLGQAITETAQLRIQTRLALEAFPVQSPGIQLTPVGTVRHSGYLRLSNRGSVRLEPTSLAGLMQLSPDQFPGDALEARQVFVYRFPSSDRRFEVLADRIQPEVSVSQVVLYQLAESDRLLSADIELDIREAAIREWNIKVPSDYSVVSVSGAPVADSIAATQVENGTRNLKVIFGADLTGRQLLSLVMEKNEIAGAGEWVLPRLDYPDAETVRGEIGIVGAAGYRITPGETELLAEKPLSYFPKAVPNLQQAFRIREPEWSATMQVELLDKSVQADVFHLYSLSEGNAFGSVLINYFVTGAPVSELNVTVPEGLGNVNVEGKEISSFHQAGGILTVSLHQPLVGAYTLLVTFEEELATSGGTLTPGRVAPIDVQGERGFLQVVSPMQVETTVSSISENLLPLDALELPAEFRLLSSSPSLGVWQYTERPFELSVEVNWFEPGTTLPQVVEFSEVSSRVSASGELVTDALYYVKSNGNRALKLQLPKDVRLWAVSAGGKAVSARSSGDLTLIPLPGGTDPNVPVEVKLRLGRPVIEGTSPGLSLPLVDAPILKTEWKIAGDEQQVLIPKGGNVSPVSSAVPANGFSILSGSGLAEFAVLSAILLLALWFCRFAQLPYLRLLGVAALLLCLLWAASAAFRAPSPGGGASSLLVSLPLLAANEEVNLIVESVSTWELGISGVGVFLALIGIALFAGGILQSSPALGNAAWMGGGISLLSIGLLLQHDYGKAFYVFLTLAIALLLLLNWRAISREKRRAKPSAGDSPAAGTTAILLAAGSLLSILCPSSVQAQIPEGYSSLQQIEQSWEIDSDTRQLKANGSLLLSGDAGDSFLFLKSPAVLTSFEGEGLSVTRGEVAGFGLCYLLTIEKGPELLIESSDPFAEVSPPVEKPQSFRATFSYESKTELPAKGLLIPTGPAAIHRLDASFNQPGWEFHCNAAVRILPGKAKEKISQANLALSPAPKATVELKPRSRDVASEETHFFVETATLYQPAPGVVGGKHKIQIRPAQGQVSSLTISIPEEQTVGSVTGPIGAWQFDAGNQTLNVTLEPAQAGIFDLHIETQGTLGPLPVETTLLPLRVAESAGEVGLIGLAFGEDAQPESIDSDTMSPVNPGDFDASLLAKEGMTLHKVYRYGKEGGELSLLVAPVAPEVRVTSKQVLSLGEERIVLSVNFAAEITRAGLFQLHFPVPGGFEVESLSGDALNHWTELTEEGSRKVVLNLNGKTIGAHTFTLTLTNPAPADFDEWEVPRFELTEAYRQTGELIIKPATGLRLRSSARQNASEIDPELLGDSSKGALAFRLLQKDWSLSLAIERLAPWITGDILHDVTLREGQTRTTLFSRLKVENASIQSLLIQLPISDPEVIKTLNASGTAVGDLVRTAEDSDLWEIQFQRRIVGDIDLRIEYEKRGERTGNRESLVPASLPDARQLGYHLAIRSGGRIEIEAKELPPGWQNYDWNSVPQSLREAGDPNAPVLTLRAVSPEEPLLVDATRHSLAEALKLRVSRGNLTSVISPLGEEITAVDLTMEVVQRSSLAVGLPPESDLYSVFVNGESVHFVRDGATWQFYILPGTDERTASVRLVYSGKGQSIRNFTLTSPQLNVPLENITWNVISPRGFRLAHQSGDLELEQSESRELFNKSSYLALSAGKKRAQENEAAQLLQEANDLLQSGEQGKAVWAFNNVANRVTLDAASNEDARVQLENLQTQQAVVGLNTRRQRLFLDNSRDTLEQGNRAEIEAGIAGNPILQKGEVNFRPQELSQLLQGNTSEDNEALRKIAERLVQHQRSTIPAPRAMTLTMPEEGTSYRFHRAVQVKENLPLALDLSFRKADSPAVGRVLFLLVLILAVAVAIAFGTRRQAAG